MSPSSPARRKSSVARREAREGYLFIAPWLVGLVLFTVGPIIASFYFSLTDFDVVRTPVFVGIDNYSRLLEDRLFWQALKVSTIYVVVSTPLGLVLSFALALLMNQRVRLLGLWRTIFYIPTLVPVIASTMLWLWIFNPQFGLLNMALRLVGIEGPLWLGHSQWALPSLIIMSLWPVGAPMLIYLAGLQGIPTDLYEAAAMDGAGAWSKFRNVTIPQMTPVIFFNLIINMIAAFQIFAQPFIMTQGGPRYATLFYVLYLYQNAFKFFRMGYASALAWVLFGVILVLTVIIFRSSTGWVYYEGEVRRR
ncbi:MAG: sugar ABC transporter permease [Caldilineaceae bacterium]|nr:sugar ABC transporter permease [Caldilineaceae bacterium]